MLFCYGSLLEVGGTTNTAPLFIEFNRSCWADLNTLLLWCSVFLPGRAVMLEPVKEFLAAQTLACSQRRHILIGLFAHNRSFALWIDSLFGREG